jgi:hypothetical protein
MLTLILVDPSTLVLASFHLLCVQSSRSNLPSTFARSAPAVYEYPSPYHPLFSHQDYLLPYPMRR